MEKDKKKRRYKRYPHHLELFSWLLSRFLLAIAVKDSETAKISGLAVRLTERVSLAFLRNLIKPKHSYRIARRTVFR